MTAQSEPVGIQVMPTTAAQRRDLARVGRTATGEEDQAELLVLGDLAQPHPTEITHVLGAEHPQLGDAATVQAPGDLPPHRGQVITRDHGTPGVQSAGNTPQHRQGAQ